MTEWAGPSVRGLVGKVGGRPLRPVYLPRRGQEVGRGVGDEVMHVPGIARWVLDGHGHDGVGDFPGNLCLFQQGGEYAGPVGRRYILSLEFLPLAHDLVEGAVGCRPSAIMGHK